MRNDWVAMLGVSLVLAGCAMAPPERQAETEPEPPVVTEDSYQAQRMAALGRALVLAESGEGVEFRGPTEYVYLSDFQFDPQTIHFKAGTVTRLRLNNLALVTHYFGAEAFFETGAEVVNILGTEVPDLRHIPVAPLSSRDVYLFIKEPGEYPLTCFVPTHRRQGMTGTLIVEP